jgi:hypothetical protein
VDCCYLFSSFLLVTSAYSPGWWERPARFNVRQQHSPSRVVRDRFSFYLGEHQGAKRDYAHLSYRRIAGTCIASQARVDEQDRDIEPTRQKPKPDAHR